MAGILDADLRGGVRQRLTGITAGNRLTILGCELLSPPRDLQHRPPAVLWLMTLDDDHRLGRIRLFHPRRRRDE